jgi:hypothetical protein
MYSCSVLSEIASKCAAVRSAAYRRAVALLMCAYFDGVARTDAGSGTRVTVGGEQVKLHPSLHTFEDGAFCGSVYRGNEGTDSTVPRLGLEIFVWLPTIQLWYAMLELV